VKGDQSSCGWLSAKENERIWPWKRKESAGALWFFFFLCREVMVGSAGGWRRGVAKEAKNGSRGEVSSGLGEGAERVIVFRVICVLGFLCDSP